RALKNSLKVCANKGWRRFWYDLHVAGGMYALIFLLAMALTGLTWSFPWYRTAFYKVFGVEAQERPMHGGEQKEHAREEGRPQRDGGRHDGRSARGDGQSGASRGEHGKGFGRGDGLHKESFGHGEHHSAFAHWQEVYDRLIRKNPDVKQIRLSDGKANVFVECFGNQRASDDYTFNPANGEITGVSLYRDRDKSDKMHGWIYAVHTGSWGGMLTRILAFIAALIGASLPLTGYYLWIKRLFRRRK
ncbi:MAG: PepSY domain-containing protein, partial [Paraprevotella sp.]|nr:PepSY domain-containing protein [Paraprevotella sp.]